VKAGTVYDINQSLPSIDKHYAVEIASSPGKVFYFYDGHVALSAPEDEPESTQAAARQGLAASAGPEINPDDKKAIQDQLIRIGLLDPPADGRWGSLSGSAARAFNRVVHGDDRGDQLTQDALKALPSFPGFKDLDYKPKDPSNSEHLIAVKCIKRMVALGAHISISMGSDKPAHIIFHVTGINPDGTKNNNRINHWNDLRFVVEVSRSGIVNVKLCRLATCEPGLHWIRNPMNKAGTFRIRFDRQWFAWVVGRHGSKQYPALVQAGEVEGYRDSNRDGSWSGEALMSGNYMGINIHHGYNSELVGQMSAGCQVAKSVAGHEEFMRLCRNDRRYIANNGYRFGNISLDGSKIP
jgi:hypothetical protein